MTDQQTPGVHTSPAGPPGAVTVPRVDPPAAPEAGGWVWLAPNGHQVPLSMAHTREEVTAAAHFAAELRLALNPPAGLPNGHVADFALALNGGASLSRGLRSLAARLFDPMASSLAGLDTVLDEEFVRRMPFKAGTGPEAFAPAVEALRALAEEYVAVAPGVLAAQAHQQDAPKERDMPRQQLMRLVLGIWGNITEVAQQVEDASVVTRTAVEALVAWDERSSAWREVTPPLEQVLVPAAWHRHALTQQRSDLIEKFTAATGALTHLVKSGAQVEQSASPVPGDAVAHHSRNP
ncbi:MAG: hypothetical protein ACTHOD_15645 [Motilibacteraceae bacterium]